MGAALTYARRYALFTLVGIAGEDDLDAPDLPLIAHRAGPADGANCHGANGQGANGHGTDHGERSHDVSAPGSPRATGRAAHPDQGLGTRTIRGSARGRSHSTLSEEDSALARDRVLHELAGIADREALNRWAHRCLPVKNTLTREDAVAVEQAFRAKLEALTATEDEPASDPAGSDPKQRAPGPPEAASTTPDLVKDAAEFQPPPPYSDRTPLSSPADLKPRRVRNKAHRDFVASQPCLICGRQPCDAHHLRFAQPRAFGKKVSDEFTVPLCRTHHRQLHKGGDEEAWWLENKVNPLEVAESLWEKTRATGQPLI
jgi:hypothetical protein